jgi:hypothetical protein
MCRVCLHVSCVHAFFYLHVSCLSACVLSACKCLVCLHVSYRPACVLSTCMCPVCLNVSCLLSFVLSAYMSPVSLLVSCLPAFVLFVCMCPVCLHVSCLPACVLSACLCPVYLHVSHLPVYPVYLSPACILFLPVSETLSATCPSCISPACRLCTALRYLSYLPMCLLAYIRVRCACTACLRPAYLCMSGMQAGYHVYIICGLAKRHKHFSSCS